MNMAANPLWGRNMGERRRNPDRTPPIPRPLACPQSAPGRIRTVLSLRGELRRFQGTAIRAGCSRPSRRQALHRRLLEGDGSDPWGNGTTVNRQSNDTRYVLRDLEQYYLP